MNIKQIIKEEISKILNEDNREKIINLIKKLSPHTKVSINPSGRLIKLTGPDGDAQIQQGISDGKWRVRYGNTFDFVVDEYSGIEYILPYVDSKFSEKEFRRALKAAKEGDAGIEEI